VPLLGRREDAHTSSSPLLVIPIAQGDEQIVVQKIPRE